MTSLAARFPLRGRLPKIGIGSGMSAIIVKELRGRMRGRRAFIVLTIHVLLLAGIAWMLQRINEEAISNFGGFGGQVTFASASVGRGIFIGLMLLQTLMVSVLAPAATAGAISSEREHQTLELLTVTPISSLAIVLGKLFSALAWVFVLILASVPVTALVFVFGGVAPDDLLRAYIVLFATVIGLGSVGIFFSALTRRTGAATGLTFVVTLVLTIGSLFVFVFMSTTSEVGPNGLRKPPPSALLFLNPFVAQIDVSCGTEDSGFSGSCGFMSGMLGTQPDDLAQPDFPQTKPFPGSNEGGGFAPAPGVGLRANVGGPDLSDDDVISAAEDGFRDRFWPKTVISFLVLATILTTASIQFVSPTRKWRPSLPGPVRRRLRRRSAT
jgi:ABC-type transport system involved in multi-copper enzyme maturation permease subunit